MARTEQHNRFVVIDERLAVLRAGPGFSSRPLQRMRRGRSVAVAETREVDGALFSRVLVTKRTGGWVQADALASRSRRGDDLRFVNLIHGSEGFIKIDRTRLFLEIFPDSQLRPVMLLLFGDLIEETAAKLSRDAAGRLRTREMAASGAPLHGFFLNYAGLDRYTRIGVRFAFNPRTRRLHYNGDAWREILAKWPMRSESLDAAKRLDSLRQKLDAGQ